MSTKQQDQQKANEESSERQKLASTIGKFVIDSLGQPEEFQRVQVHALWDDHYRVNVFVGTDVVSVRVAHSFFLVADRKGNIVNCTPKLVRSYGTAR